MNALTTGEVRSIGDTLSIQSKAAEDHIFKARYLVVELPGKRLNIVRRAVSWSELSTQMKQQPETFIKRARSRSRIVGVKPG